MKPLTQMSLGERVITTVVIVIVILLAFAFVGWVSGRWAEVPAQTLQSRLYEGIPQDQRLLHLDKAALDSAYSQQLLKLWGVWLADGGKDPKYFRVGLENARRAYGLAEAQITRREQELRDKR